MKTRIPHTSFFSSLMLIAAVGTWSFPRVPITRHPERA